MLPRWCSRLPSHKACKAAFWHGNTQNLGSKGEALAGGAGVPVHPCRGVRGRVGPERASWGARSPHQALPQEEWYNAPANRCETELKGARWYVLAK